MPFQLASLSKNNWKTKINFYLFSLIFGMTLLIVSGGCASFGDVDDEFTIDEGIAPEYQDENVRFRTTYYFRVFDYCHVLDSQQRDKDYHDVDGVFTQRKNGRYKLLNDSLYRFRMTGKASAMFKTVYFESGTLRAEQIDPFGATIEYDKEKKKFKVQSTQQGREESQREEIYQKIDRLYKQRDEILERKGQLEAINAINDLIMEQINLMTISGEYPKARTISVLLFALQSRKEAEMALKESLDILEKAEKLRSHKSEPMALLKKLKDYRLPNQDTFEWLFQRSLDDQILFLSDSIKDMDYILDRIKAIAKWVNEDFEKIKTQLKNKKEKLEEVKNDNQDTQNLQSAQQEYDDAKRLFEAQSLYLTKILALKHHVLSQEKRANSLRHILPLLSEKSNGIDLPSSAQIRARCPGGTPARRGFQVLGPEGFRQFDQDERLVMAMTTDSRPLIGLLQELSGRKLQTQRKNAAIRPLVKERAHIWENKQEWEQIKLDLRSGDLLHEKISSESFMQRVLNAFESKN